MALVSGVLLLLLAGGRGRLDLSAYEPLFEAWRAEHGKAYVAPADRAARLAAFAENVDYVAAHNAAAGAGAASNALALKEFADLTHDEFRAARLGRLAVGWPSGRHRPGLSPALVTPCLRRWTRGRAARSPRSRTRAAAPATLIEEKHNKPCGGSSGCITIQYFLGVCCSDHKLVQEAMGEATWYCLYFRIFLKCVKKSFF